MSMQRFRRRFRLKQSESQSSSTKTLAAVFHANPVATLLLSYPEGRVVAINPSFCSILDCAPDHVLGQTVAEAYIWKEIEHYQQLVQRVDTANSIHHYETELRSPTGCLKKVILSATALDIDGAAHLLITAHPLENGSEANLISPSSTMMLNAVLDSVVGIIGRFRVFADRTMVYDYCSAGCEQIFGFTPQEMMTSGLWWSRIPSDDQQSVIQPVLDRISSESSICCEYRFHHKDGSLRWIQSQLSIQHDESSECWVVVSVETDISDRKYIELKQQQTKAALRQSEERFRQIVSNVDQFFFVRDVASGRYLYVSPAYETIWGRTCDSLYQHPTSWIDAVHPGDRPSLLASLHQQTQETSVQREYRIRRPNGEIRWINANIFSVIDDQGDVTRWVGIADDVTERKQFEQEIKQQRDFRELLFNESNDALFLVDGSTQLIVDCNQRTLEIFEAASKEEMLNIEGHTLQKRPFTSEELADIRQELSQTGYWSSEIKYMTRTGREFWGDLSAKQIDFGEQQFKLIRVVDISDRKAAEQALQQHAQREQSLNQVIQAIRQSLDLDTVFATATAEVSKLLHTDQADVVQYLADRPCWLIRASHRQDPSQPNVVDMIVADESRNQFAAQIKRFKPVRVHDASTFDDDISQDVAHTRAGAWLFVPIVVNGTLWGCVGVINDQPTLWTDEQLALMQTVTDQLAIAIQQAELYKRLQTSESALKDVLNNAIAAVCSFRIFPNRDWIYDYYSSGSLLLYGYTPEELTADKHLWMSRVHPDDLEQIIFPLYEEIYHERTCTYEYRFYHKDNTLRWHLATSTARQDKAEDCWVATLLAVDITERKHAEEKLTESQSLYKSLADVLPLCLFRKDRSDRITFANQAFLNMLGLSLDECLTKTTRDVNPKNLADQYQADDQHIFQTGEIVDRVDTAVVPGTDERRYIQAVKAPVYDVEGQIVEVQGIFWDITERVKTEQALELHSLIIRNMAEGVCLIRAADGIIVYANPKFEQLFGYESGDLTGKHASTFNYEDNTLNAKETYQTIANCLNIYGEYSYEVHNIKKDGTPFWCRATSVRFEHPEYGTVYVTVQEDVTERKRATLELQQAKEAAEAANYAKSRFLANMSHELRTPLNAILGFSQLLATDPSLDQTQQEHIEIINDSGEHLLSLINDVLEVSKIEAGRVTLNEDTVDLYQLLTGLDQMLRLKATEKKLALDFRRAPNLPQHITTDGGKLRQVLLNLLSNAIKFTHRGGVTLYATLGKQPENHEAIAHTANLPPISPQTQTQTLHFEVTDTGCGIAAAEIQDLFSAFVQAKNSPQTSEGTGLGLTISRHFVNLMGGDITVQSVLGQGSTFAFDITVGLADTTPALTPVETSRVITLAPGQPPYRILIVEDQWQNRQLLIGLLASIGFELHEAHNGQEAIAQWESWHPHLILMDLRMPEMNGFDAVRYIRAKEQTPDSPPFYSSTPVKIIALTADAFEETRRAALEAGFDDFIHKPIRDSLLLAKITEHLGARYLHQVAHRQAPGPLWDEDNLISALSLMPPLWIRQLHQAAIEGFEGRLLQLIEQIPNSHSSLAESLSRWIKNFQFEQIIALTQRILHEP